MVDNLKQAINEVFRPKKSKVNNKQRELSQEKNEKTDDSIKKPAQARNDPNQKSLMQQNNSKESNKEFHIIKKRDNASTEQTTIITKNTKISGTITTDSNLIVSGLVEGDIESESGVLVTGRVCGDIKCDSAEMDNAQIEGNINVANKLEIKSGTRIAGDLSAKEIEISGEIRGDITSIQAVKLFSDARVIGNVTSSSISIEIGAVLQGSVNIEKEDAGDADLNAASTDEFSQ